MGMAMDTQMRTCCWCLRKCCATSQSNGRRTKTSSNIARDLGITVPTLGNDQALSCYAPKLGECIDSVRSLTQLVLRL